MFGIVRLGLILLVGLTIVYVMVSLYSRSVRKERLEKEWDEGSQPADPEAREAFIRAGLQAYKSSLRRKLIALVYVVPVVLIAIVTYLTNLN